MQNLCGNWSEEVNEDLKQHYLPVLKGLENAPVLDFGSGQGRVIEFLQGNGFRNVRGFDRSEPTTLAPAVRAVSTFGGDGAEFLRKANTVWSAVILKDVIYYFDDSDAVALLRELGTHMAPNAHLLVEIFNGATFTGPYVQYKDRGIRRILTEQSVESLLQDAGFKVERMTGMPPAITGVGSLLFWLGSRLWKLKLRMIYWLERGWDSQNPTILEKKIFVVGRVMRKI